MSNGALVLKSKNQLNANVMSMEFEAYKKRVLADGGYIVNEQATREAIHFASSVGITKESDAGIASLAWGVKHLNGGYYTLYSLFNPNANYSLAVSSGSVTTRDGFNVASLLGTLANDLSTINGIDISDSLIALNINKPPVKATGADYGSVALQFAQFKVYKEDADKTKYDSILELYYERSNANQLPNAWSNKIATYRANPAYSDKLQGISTPPADRFSSMAAYIDPNKLSVYSGGKNTFAWDLVPSAPFSGKHKASFAKRFNANDASKFISPTYTDIAEVWLVTGLSEGVAQQLSKRADEIYNKS